MEVNTKKEEIKRIELRGFCKGVIIGIILGLLPLVVIIWSLRIGY